VDNLCHTLVGAAIGAAGLRRTTRFASATLMIAANLPDLDVLVFATDTPSIEFRRGWTHGVLAQMVLPVALTGIMLLIGRLRPPRVASGEGTLAPPLRAPWLLALSYLGLYSHVFLDYLNTYGIRLLTPFDWGWFYGDAVFIMDPWLWLTLGLGVWLSRERRSPMPARAALTIAAVYIGAMLVSASAARAIVLDAWTDARGMAPVAAMVGPVAVTPFDRQVIIDAGDHYETGEFRWLAAPRVAFHPGRVAKNQGREEVRTARQSPAFRSFLVWSRFPFFQFEANPAGTRVSVGDMRFSFGNPLGDALARGRFTATTVVPRSAN
jgi:inner membrane protein